MIIPLYKRVFIGTAVVVTAAFIGIQFIPSSFSRTNPPVTGEPAWDSPATRATFVRACSDCHSNESRFPWYSTIAPVSWLIESDIRDGRRHFNVSEWDRSERGGEDAAKEVDRGAMPIGPYLLMHPETNLNAAEKRIFVDGLRRTFGNSEKEEDD